MPLAVIYLTGVLAGLALIDDRPARRLALAVAWPLGPAAFVVTIAGLIAASLILFPRVGTAAAVAGAALWWTLG